VGKHLFLSRELHMDAKETSPVARIESIDVLRGLTILIMIFVNDIAGVGGTPAWMKHISPHNADGMTFVDIVFPAFLFIVGMALPFAIGRRLDKGESLLPIGKHILIRTLALLIIGVFMVNSETISSAGTINTDLWNILMYAGVILVWKVPSQNSKVNIIVQKSIRWLGIIILLACALLYRGPGEKELIELRPQWWGIIGLIGWAYLVTCLAYIPLRKNLTGLLGVVAILYTVFMADQVGFFTGAERIIPWVDIGSMLGSHAAIVVSGLILGLILSPASPVQTHHARMWWAFWYGAGLAVAAVLLHSLNGLHQMFIINKIYATPPWCLWSSAITVWVWVLVYWLIDVKGWKRWKIIVEPAGANALFAYILAPLCYSLFALSSKLFGGFDWYGWLGDGFAIGFWRSVLFAFAMTWLAGGLRRMGLWLKL
jgi:heparan-alpha-glucosaminide N-acetyltransferase